ncbi:blue light sensor protein [Devosia soli]|uniref:Blue light sensor protein n=1 Tax=Devosia soli TaxID=361041 RepID=A0A0F5LFG1_9HYPH|nr:BLUF domain-containing protein [Devosia soli]KKB80954.1 blue light sensor protein [Devosia soli]
MPDALYQLVYYSRNHIAGDQAAFTANVENILAASRRNNVRDGITGALLFNNGCFAQVLEGPLGVVEAAFERIQQDERHGEVSLLALSPIETRSFPNWAMGYVGSSAAQAASFSAIGQGSGFDLSLLGSEEIHRILRDLAVEEESAAA